jgi:prenyltransferase beta subunit
MKRKLMTMGPVCLSLALLVGLLAFVGNTAQGALAAASQPARPGTWGPEASPENAAAAQAALDWLRPQQEVTGGFGSPALSLEAVFALNASSEKASDWRKQPTGISLLNYVLSRGIFYSHKGPGETGKLAVALAGQDACWPPLTPVPMDWYNPISGTFRGVNGSVDLAWAILGTRALSQSVPVAAVQTLKGMQMDNGGWEWTPSYGEDTNSTSLVVQALLAAGEAPTSTAVIDGLAYLRGAQNTDGGFPYDPVSEWNDSDTNSTAFSIQAILAAGQDPLTGTWYIISGTNGASPVDFLRSLQLPDGSFEWQKGYGSDLFATEQAVAPLLGKPMLGKTAILAPCTNVPDRFSFLPLTSK